MSETCERRGRLFGGCHFEGRYDLSEPIFPEELKKVSGPSFEEFRRRTYVGDVCTTCGRFAPAPRTPKIEESAS